MKKGFSTLICEINEMSNIPLIIWIEDVLCIEYLCSGPDPDRTII